MKFHQRLLDGAQVRDALDRLAIEEKERQALLELYSDFFGYLMLSDYIRRHNPRLQRDIEWLAGQHLDLFQQLCDLDPMLREIEPDVGEPGV